MFALSYPVQESLSLIGKIVCMARKEANLSMSALAQRAGIDRKTIARIEKGDPNVGLGIFLTIIWLLDIPLLQGIDLGHRQTRKQLSLLLNSFIERQTERRHKRKLNDPF
jgi:predicted transcriptional regulator